MGLNGAFSNKHHEIMVNSIGNSDGLRQVKTSYILRYAISHIGLYRLISYIFVYTHSDGVATTQPIQAYYMATTVIHRLGTRLYEQCLYTIIFPLFVAYDFAVPSFSMGISISSWYKL
jgi:hypothetical protein